MLTQEQIKNRVNYDPITGQFIWSLSFRNKKKGTRAEHSHPKGYLAVRVCGEKFLAHRLAWFYMTGEWPKQQIDHIDRNKTNNAWTNLRDVSGTENLMNTKELWESNTSGVKGVCFYGRYGLWQAQIKHKGKQIYLGRFSTIEEAAMARKTAELRYSNDFS